MPVASILTHFTLALGRGFQLCLRGGNNSWSHVDFTIGSDQMNIDALTVDGLRGGNNSWIHVDFTIGSDQMNIDALTVDGRREASMRNGERAFTL